MSRLADFAETDTARLEAHVRVWLGGRIRCLQIHAAENGLILRGFVRTYHAKQLAQHAVMMETPLPILANEIEVSLATVTCASDWT